jgi:hypothetical protein
MVVVGERASNGGLVGLHDRLERLAVTVERQLEILSYEPDDAVLTASLAPLHQRAQKVIRAATEVRAAASLLLEGTAELELDALAEEVRSEVEALKHGRDVLDRAASPI